MIGALAVCKRDLKKFRKQPIMMMMSLLMPFLSLVLIGSATGGTIAHIPIAVVRESYGPASTSLMGILQNEQSCEFGGVNCENSFQLVDVSTLGQAQTMLRYGTVKAIVYMPLGFDNSAPNSKIIVTLDTTDPIVAATVSGELTQAGQQLTAQLADAPQDAPASNILLTSMYRYLLYIEFMAPGTLIQAIMFAAVFGGGITILNDKQARVIEGYLVTPLTRYEIVVGVLLSGVIKALISSYSLLLLAILVVGVRPNFDAVGFLLTLSTLALTALGLISMMTAYAIRSPNSDVYQFTLVPLNISLYFTGGAIWPVQAFPWWMRAISVVNPETYANHALRLLMYKGAGLAGISGDLLFLGGFTVVMVTLATLAFKRGL